MTPPESPEGGRHTPSAGDCLVIARRRDNLLPKEIDSRLRAIAEDYSTAQNILHGTSGLYDSIVTNTIGRVRQEFRPIALVKTGTLPLFSAAAIAWVQPQNFYYLSRGSQHPSTRLGLNSVAPRSLLFPEICRGRNFRVEGSCFFHCFMKVLSGSFTKVANP